MVPTLADWCAVDVTDGAGGLRRLAVAHADPSREAEAWEIVRRYPHDPAAERGTFHVYRTGEPDLHEALTDEMAVAGAQDSEHLALLRRLDLRSYVGAPLVTHGRTIGVLALATSGLSGRQYGPADLPIIMEVASRAAIAVDHSIVHAAEQRARADAELAAARGSRLHDVSVALATTYTESEVGEVALDAVFGALAPRGAGLLLLDGAGTTLEITAARGFPPGMVERFRRIPLEAPLPACAAVRTGEPVIFETRDDRSRNYPSLDRELAETRSGAIAALPLQVHGKVLGALTLSFADERVISDADRAFMLTVASQCAQALERARLFDAERRARSEAERSLEALRLSEFRFRTVFEARMLGIAFWDGARVSDANAAFLDLLGYTADDLAAGEIGHGRLTPPEYQEADRRATDECRAHGTCAPYEKEFFRKDGTRVPVLVGGTLLPDGTGVFFVLDMTAHREAIEQLQASQRMEAVGRLAGGVAHEINNALQGVLGFSRFVLKALDPGDPVRDDVDQIERSARRAAEITQQLLAYSRRQLLRPAPHDLAAIVASFEPMMRQALGPGRRLEVRAPVGPATILADRGQIEQVLLNLTLNARDAMPGDGRLVVEIGRSESAAGPGKSARYVTLTVTDNGRGMDGRTLSQIFDPFFTTKAPGEGTGLGLAVVQGIVRQSGGQIFASSEPGQGATFRILLPAADRAQTAAAAAERPPMPRGGETLLLVEDEAAVRSYIGRLLRELGYEVIEAASPDAALAALDGSGSRGAPVSLIVSDVLMPAGGGEAVGKGAEAWARRVGIPAIPIVYVSGQSDEQSTRRELAGRAAFLQKPFDAEELARTVRALLDGVGAAVQQG